MTKIISCQDKKKGCISDCSKDKDFISEVKEIYDHGELFVYPTETLYALGCDPFNEKALEKLYFVKNRPKSMPVSIAVSKIEMMKELVYVNELARKIYNRFLPGPVTLLCKQKRPLPHVLSSEEGKIGIRVPEHPIALMIIDLLGPVCATSANLHGDRDPKDMETAKKQLEDKVKLYIDCGELKYQSPSTIVDCSGSSINIIRKGVISHKELTSILE
jgi:L-threonylcarbamoyladenylate synthase